MPLHVIELKSKNEEKVTKLSSANIGDTIRFANITFDEAMNDNEKGFWFVTAVKSSRPDCVSLISIDFKTPCERDGDRPIIVHPSKIEIARVV